MKTLFVLILISMSLQGSIRFDEASEMFYHEPRSTLIDAEHYHIKATMAYGIWEIHRLGQWNASSIKDKVKKFLQTDNDLEAKVLLQDLIECDYEFPASYWFP